MNISNKAMVAVDALVALHQNRQRQATSLVTLSSLLNVSVSYLEFIFKELRTVGLVSASRGPGGGYQLTPVANSFSLQSLCELFQNLDDLEVDEAQEEMSAELWSQTIFCSGFSRFVASSCSTRRSKPFLTNPIAFARSSS